MRERRENRYWVFDSPLLRDPLLILGVVAGIAWALISRATGPGARRVAVHAASVP